MLKECCQKVIGRLEFKDIERNEPVIWFSSIIHSKFNFKSMSFLVCYSNDKKMGSCAYKKKSGQKYCHRLVTV